MSETRDVAPDTGEALTLRGLRREFRQADSPPVVVLNGADLMVRAGEIAALIGPSGSGKSTLLQIAGLLEKPDAGEVLLAGEAASGLTEAGRTRMRRRTIGLTAWAWSLLPLTSQ